MRLDHRRKWIGSVWLRRSGAGLRLRLRIVDLRPWPAQNGEMRLRLTASVIESSMNRLPVGQEFAVTLGALRKWYILEGAAALVDEIDKALDKEAP